MEYIEEELLRIRSSAKVLPMWLASTPSGLLRAEDSFKREIYLSILLKGFLIYVSNLMPNGL